MKLAKRLMMRSVTAGAIPTDGLIAHYSMDISGTTLIDAVGTYPGTLVGTFSSPAGVVGSALEAANTSAYVTVANLGSWFAGRNACALSLWVKPNNDDSNYAPVFCVSYTSHTGVYYLVYIHYGADSQSYVMTSNSFRQNFYGKTVSSSVYHHIVVSYASSKFNVWEDGIQILSNISCASAMPAAAPTAMMGRIPMLNQTANAARINLDQIRIYDRALTSVDVAALYAEAA